MTLRFDTNTVEVIHNGKSAGKIGLSSYGQAKFGLIPQDHMWDSVNSIKTFDIEREIIASNLSTKERLNLNHPVNTPNGETLFHFTKYAYATIKLSGATYDVNTGMLAIPNSANKLDLTNGGKYFDVSVYGKEGKMNISACTQEKGASGGIVTRAFTVDLGGNYSFKELPPAQVIETCK